MKFFEKLLPLLLVLAFHMSVACTSKKSHVKDPTELSDTKKSKLELQPIEAASVGEFIIDPAEADKIYSAMIAVEAKSGTKIEAQKLHTSRGSISCKKDGAIISCYFRARVERLEFLSSRQKMGRKLTTKVWKFFTGIRPELKDELIITGNLICDYLGKKTPPFNVEKLTCKVVHPRLSNEAIVVESTAENIANILRGEIPFTDSITSVRGSILCQWIKGSGRSPCVLRPIVEGVLKETFLEVPPRFSSSIGSLLLETIKDDLIYRSEVKPKKIDLPSEIMGSVICVVNSDGFISLGRRTVTCRIAI